MLTMNYTDENDCRYRLKSVAKKKKIQRKMQYMQV